MKFFYYYLRDIDHHPFGCVCLGIDDTLIYSRGIALCSKNDIFIKKVARKLSRSRCMHAMKTNKVSLPINYDNTLCLGYRFYPITKLKEVSTKIIPQLYLFSFKSEYKANLTPYEYEIVKDDSFKSENNEI